MSTSYGSVIAKWIAALDSALKTDSEAAMLEDSEMCVATYKGVKMVKMQ
jgi:hypothetical protein